ncbi:MAG: restriction endonuclease subunit S, partial [Gammaproteobacteria bacterium]
MAMIDGLKPYPAYKDSGVPWLGEVPGHWEVPRLRDAVDMRVSNVDKHTKEGELRVRLCNYHLALLRPFRELMNGSYLLRAMQSPGVSYQFHVEANGVTRYGLSHAAIKSISLPLPPLPEQAAIVRFLDHADRRIRRYIRAKQKLIKLLEEQKQAIIHRAVTRGLDPSVRLKPSGVEWLGDVP